MGVKRGLGIFLFGAALAVSVATAAAQAPGDAVAPKQRFASPDLTIHAPDDEGWIVTGNARNGLSFGKRGDAPDATFGAQAVLFELPPTADADALVAAVKARIADANPAPRFREIEATYAYGETRGYPCVDVRARYDDEGARAADGRPLRLKVAALYCRHPVNASLGFLAAYSYRGPEPEADIAAASAAFVEAIQVPPPG